MRGEKPGNVLTTLVFTDIVASSQVVEELGDRRWRELLARHHAIVRAGLRDHGGRELDTAGDGVFARFDSPGSAINFAAATADAVRELGIEIRAGVHFGECEVFEGKLSGVNVHAAARTMGTAGPGEILVTSNVRDLVRGGRFGFGDRGVHELRGIEGEWRLFEVTSIEDSHRSPPLPEGEARARRDQIVPAPLVKRRSVRLAAVAAAVLLVAAGAAFGLVRAMSGAAAGPLTGCELAWAPPIDDHGFNQAIYDGLTDASTTWGIGVRAAVPKRGSVREWIRNMNGLIHQRCGLIVTFGTIFARIVATAKANPSQRFAIADAADIRGTANLLSIEFAPDQGAFLAGYLAAGVSKTHKIGTFGGIPLPTVIPFMDGFAAGILYYNRTHGTSVELLGWNPMTRKGMFVSTDQSNFFAFGDFGAARRLGKDLVHSGADIIFPVDGPTGEDASCATALRSSGVLLIGVDTDQHYSAPECEARWLTSVMKVYRRMVYLAMGQIVRHQFNGGLLTGTLANGGVGLAPFYGLEARVSPRLRGELGRIGKGIKNGSITVDPRNYRGL